MYHLDFGEGADADDVHGNAHVHVPTWGTGLLPFRADINSDVGTFFRNFRLRMPKYSYQSLNVFFFNG